jgi:hypothetical protein
MEGMDVNGGDRQKAKYMKMFVSRVAM